MFCQIITMAAIDSEQRIDEINLEEISEQYSDEKLNETVNYVRTPE